MKVIILKDCKQGKVNEIVDVSDGYAKNFMIPKGFAIPVNHKTKLKREAVLKDIKDTEDSNIAKSNKSKAYIESLKPVFYLTENNAKITGSITRKQIVSFLRDNGVKLPDPHLVENVKIESLGITNVKITIYKDIFATLQVEVKGK